MTNRLPRKVNSYTSVSGDATYTQSPGAISPLKTLVLSVPLVPTPPHHGKPVEVLGKLLQPAAKPVPNP